MFAKLKFTTTFLNEILRKDKYIGFLARLNVINMSEKL